MATIRPGGGLALRFRHQPPPALLLPVTGVERQHLGIEHIAAAALGQDAATLEQLLPDVVAWRKRCNTASRSVIANDLNQRTRTAPIGSSPRQAMTWVAP